MNDKITFLGLWIICSVIWQFWVSGVFAPVLGFFTSLIATNGIYISFKGLGGKNAED